jgi:hypothetical protein
LTGQSEGLPNLHPETITQLTESIAPLDVPTAEQIEQLRAEGRLVEREGQYYLLTGVEVHDYGEDSPVAGEAFPAAQWWTTAPGFIMRGHSERIRQDQYIEYLAANLEAGILVARAQEVELSGTSGPLPVTWAEGATVEVPRSVQVMAGWSKVGIVRQLGDPWPGRGQAETEAYETYAGGIGALYREILPYFQSQPLATRIH